MNVQAQQAAAGVGGVVVSPQQPPQAKPEGAPAYLKDVSITFDTHNDDKSAPTVVHVFVKNRSATSRTPEANSDFISNWLALQRYQGNGDLSDTDRNPYLAYGLNLAKLDGPLVPGVEFAAPSSHTYSLALCSNTIRAEDIDLPVVNIHVLASGGDRWIFDYTITFTFDDPNVAPFSYSSTTDVPGIILDSTHRNYSGICSENPHRNVEPVAKAQTDAVLKRVTIEFASTDDDKASDTVLNVHIANRLGATSSQDIAIGLDLLHGQEFPTSGPDQYKSYTWSADDGTLAAGPIYLRDMVLPMAYIRMVPTGGDSWSFDYQVTFEFVDPHDFGEKPQIYSWRQNGVVLDATNNKHAGVYQGRPFPTDTHPPTAPALVEQPIDRTNPPKTIPISFLQAKFDEFVNNRNGADDTDNPPLRKIRLDNSGETNIAVLRESYVDVQAITALNTHALPGQAKVAYVSSPRSLGQLHKSALEGLADVSLYFNDIDMASLSLTVDPTQTDAPFVLALAFDCSGSQEVVGVDDWGNLTRFDITLKLTLGLSKGADDFGRPRTVIDVMSWVDEINPLLDPLGAQATALKEKHIVVSFDPNDGITPAHIRWEIRDRIFDMLTTKDPISKRSPRDAINSLVTSWLLGGLADNDRDLDGNNVVIDSVSIDENNITISYAGPRKVFAPATPASWPSLPPGNLANIDHIVVLMMENRSFDHMLGYLSLPVAKGGAGRTDVDGLKGGEANSYLGTSYPSQPVTDTLFAPDPPHGFEPVAHAIDGGKMDGFASSYGIAHGAELAGKIMGHQTAATVPVYDALARDFAIGHRWFASHPGSTFPNRFYMLTGRPNLDADGFWEFDNSSPMRPVFTPTIFDYLSDPARSGTGQPVSWAYFEHGYCSLRFFERYTFDDEHIFTADDPANGFFARAAAGTLPSVSFIDPHFIEYPPDGNCDGAPADVKDGQEFVRKVVEAVVTSPAWNKTMLLIVYDEHGGFYDHVPPPPAAGVSPEFPIKTLGVRVPAFVISPWVRPGSVFGYDSPVVRPGGGAQPVAHAAVATADLHFDHTSILKTIARRFMSTNPPYMGARYAAAKDLSIVLGSQLRQPAFPPFVRHRLQSAASQLLLTVQNGNPGAHTPLWQHAADGSTAQDFAFEDAGNGFVYIRSNVSNLYLTAAPAQPQQVKAGVAPPAGAAKLRLIQDVKYPAGAAGVAAAARNPALQKWKLTPVDATPAHRGLFLISSQAFPGKALQPAAPKQDRSAIVLGDPGGNAAWRVSRPTTT